MKPENAIPLGESIVRYLLSWDINFFQFRCTNTGRRNSLLNIISSSISTSIFFKSKNRRVEKKEGTVEARPIRYSILRLFSFTWERGGGGEMREQMSILLLVATRSVLREIHGMEIAGERGKKRLEGIWTWFFREVLRLTSGLPAFRGYRLLSWSGWKPYLIY